MGFEALVADQVREISRPCPPATFSTPSSLAWSLPPLGGLVRTLGALIGGLAVALGQVKEKKDSGGIPRGTVCRGACPRG